MTKQEVIQQAWRECYNSIFWSKGFDTNTGWMEYNSDAPRLRNVDGKNIIIGFEDIEIDVEGYDTPQFGYVTSCFRPKSLRGIQNNNGWIKIETEADLPIDRTQDYLVVVDGLKGYREAFYDREKWCYSVTDSEGNKTVFSYDNVTHWRPLIIVPKYLY